MYCGRRRIAASVSAQVSSAVATGEPALSATTMPSRVQASMSMCGPARPVCEISFSLGSFSSSWRGKCVRSRMSDPLPERGGRSRRYYTVTPAGLSALRDSREAWLALWKGVESLLEKR